MFCKIYNKHIYNILFIIYLSLSLSIPIFFLFWLPTPNLLAVAPLPIGQVEGADWLAQSFLWLLRPIVLRRKRYGLVTFLFCGIFSLAHFRCQRPPYPWEGFPDCSLFISLYSYFVHQYRCAAYVLMDIYLYIMYIYIIYTHVSITLFYLITNDAMFRLTWENTWKSWKHRL